MRLQLHAGFNVRIRFPVRCMYTKLRRAASSNKIKLESQLRLYRDDKLIKATEIIPVSECETDLISNGIPLGFI
jgi:hypothetical protein